MNGSKRWRVSLAYVSRFAVAFLVGAMLFGIAGVTSAHAAQQQLPVAVDDNYSCVHDQTLTIDASSGVLANDTIPPAPPSWHAEVISAPPSGTLNFSPDGSFTYTPPAGFVGTAGFQYQIIADNPQAGSVSGAGVVAAAFAYIAVINNLPVVV